MLAASRCVQLAAIRVHSQALRSTAALAVALQRSECFKAWRRTVVILGLEGLDFTWVGHGIA